MTSCALHAGGVDCHIAVFGRNFLLRDDEDRVVLNGGYGGQLGDYISILAREIAWAFLWWCDFAKPDFWRKANRLNL